MLNSIDIVIVIIFNSILVLLSTVCSKKKKIETVEKKTDKEIGKSPILGYERNGRRRKAILKIVAKSCDDIVKEHERKFTDSIYTKGESFTYGGPDLNRYKDVLCYDKTRLEMKDVGYIHAEQIANNNYNYIITQGPMPKTINDFWLMCALKKVSCIVQLCRFTENGETHCEKYYPSIEGKTEEYGNVDVKLLKKKIHPIKNLVWTVFEVEDRTIREGSNKTLEEIEKEQNADLKIKEEKTAIIVHHIFVPWWSEKRIPDDPRQTVQLIRWLEYEMPRPIVVMCDDGAGRSLTFAAIHYANDYFMRHPDENTNLLENAIDNLKKQKAPNAVRTAQEYLFISACLVYSAMIDGLLGEDLGQPFLDKYRDYVRKNFRN